MRMEESRHPVVVQPVHQNPLHAPSVVGELSSEPSASTQRVSRVWPVPQVALTVLPASPLHASAAQASLMVARENGVHESAPGALAPAARYVKDVSEK